jgi:hypothetical protein
MEVAGGFAGNDVILHAGRRYDLNDVRGRARERTRERPKYPKGTNEAGRGEAGPTKF